MGGERNGSGSVSIRRNIYLPGHSGSEVSIQLQFMLEHKILDLQTGEFLYIFFSLVFEKDSKRPIKMKLLRYTVR